MKKTENALQLFKNDEFGTIRTMKLGNEPWFVAKDVCDILGIQNVTQATNQLEDFERSMFNIGRQGEANIISESGFYTLVLRSRKPIAKPFRLWVTQEVLPQIRKTGGYIPVIEDEPNEVFLARAVKIAQETIEKKDEIIEMQNKRISSLEKTEKDWKLLMDASGTFSVNEIAHFIGIGEYTLFLILRNLNVLFKNDNNDNIPYEKPLHKGKFITVAAIAPDGSSHSQTRVLPDGISYITKLLRKHGYIEVSA